MTIAREDDHDRSARDSMPFNAETAEDAEKES